MSKKNYNQAYRNARMDTTTNDAVIPDEIRVDTVDASEYTVSNNLTTVDATVVNCEKLNIRSEPNKSSAILSVINKSSKLTIFPESSTEDWYKVQTEDGIEGFCMKAYVI